MSEKIPAKARQPARAVATLGVTRWLTVLAQDPSVRKTGSDTDVLITTVEVPCERLRAGPRGHRFSVIDFDATADVFYKPGPPDELNDPFEGKANADELCGDPRFHAQNVYALAANTLLTFERALGRHVSWGFSYGTHELKILPHAFADANAYYSRRDESLLLGYFHDEDGTIVHTCLSRDIVVHETTHAVLDGLKPELDRPSSADQAAFHEGYSDVIALLSVLSSEELIADQFRHLQSKDGTIILDEALEFATKEGFILGVAEQFGAATDTLGRGALRRSVLVPREKTTYANAPTEAHDRGEVFVAPMVSAFLDLWRYRLTRKAKAETGAPSPRVELWRVAEEGVKSAEHLLRISIRALDYLPPAHVRFGDFLSAALTADQQACPDDERYRYRQWLKQAFADYGIEPASSTPDGLWLPPPQDDINYNTVRLQALKTDVEAVYRFVHDNADVLRLATDALTKVSSVRPVTRVSDDGFMLHETVAEYFQLMSVDAATLRALKLKVPSFLKKKDDRVWLHGGGTLVFDETGRLKFHIHNRLNGSAQNDRLEELWRNGDIKLTNGVAVRGGDGDRRFAKLHRLRALPPSTAPDEEWS